MEDIILIVGPQWAWVLAFAILWCLAGSCGAILVWVLRVRPLRTELEEQRKTEPCLPPKFEPPRPQSDTLVSPW